jgi:heme/copper-type cytochrome/quinol oxidase subunit 3
MTTGEEMAQAPTAANAAVHEEEHEKTTTGLNHKKLLMWAFLASDCMFFGTLIATYLVYKGKSKVGALPEDVFSIPVTSVSTFVLLMSSMSMVLAYAALRRGSLKGFRIWLLSTILLGSTFLGFQFFEFYEFVNHEVHIDCHEFAASPDDFSPFEAGIAGDECTEGVDEYEGTHGLTPRTNLFGTTFFTLTGLHGTHVTIGVVWLLGLFFYSFKKGAVTPARHLDTDLAALYWHFVDVVWIIIFPVVYLFGVFEGFPT